MGFISTLKERSSFLVHCLISWVLKRTYLIYLSLDPKSNFVLLELLRSCRDTDFYISVLILGRGWKCQRV